MNDRVLVHRYHCCITVAAQNSDTTSNAESTDMSPGVKIVADGNPDYNEMILLSSAVVADVNPSCNEMILLLSVLSIVIISAIRSSNILAHSLKLLTQN